ncbi:MAG: TolC family protein [Francisellaceae bacterium]
MKNTKARRLSIVLLSLILAVSGCSYFAPEYKAPEVLIPDQWQAANNGKAVNLPYLYWWQQFKDPQLNQAINTALVYNREVALARSNIEMAEAALDTVALNWIPGVTFLAGLINSNNNTTLNGLSLPQIDGTAGFIGFLPQYTLNIFSNITRYKQAGYRLTMTEFELKAVRLAVIAKVVSAYFIATAAHKRLRLLQRLSENVNLLYQNNNAMVEEGFGSLVITNQLYAELNDINGQMALAQQDMKAAKNALRYLLGQPPGDYILKTDFAAFNPEQMIPGNLPASVIAERPDIAAAQAQLKAANESIAVSSSLLTPNLNLNAFFARIQLYDSDQSGDSSINSKSLYATSIISPTVFGLINQTKTAYTHAEISYLDLINKVLHEVENALLSQHGALKKYQHNLVAKQAIADNVKISKALYDQGLISSNTYLISRIENTTVSLVILESKLSVLLSDVVVYQVLGGGSAYDIDSQKKDQQGN